MAACYVRAQWIIPALAGNTSFQFSVQFGRWDHPRACGEHLPSSLSIETCMGSSPRLRGTLGDPYLRPLDDGDHPRACGEHELTLFDNGVALGSSPRLRGTLVRRIR